jgi:geranylgeranyl pyrophosphate synthase
MKTAELAKLLSVPDLPAYISRVDDLLCSLIVADSPSIRDPALRILRNGGKRLRPILVIAAASSRSKKIDDNVIASCAAIELAHIGTIVHDDIIDKADVRWGEPTINSQEGVDNAIIIGDYLLSIASAQAATVSKEVAHVLASTIATVCDGQSQETSDEFNVNRSIDSYLATIRKKTAVLISAACQIGGLCADLPAAQVDALVRYGEAFGMTFQLIDDVLDFLSTSEIMGKPVGNDMKEGVYTMPLLLALQGPSNAIVAPWLGKTPSTHPVQPEVVDTLLHSGAIKKTLAEVRRYNLDAVNAISEFGDSDLVIGLSKLPDYYLDWALKKCVVVVEPDAKAVMLK